MSWRTLAAEALATEAPDRQDGPLRAAPVKSSAPPALPEALVSRLAALSLQEPPEGLTAAKWVAALDRADALLRAWGAAAAALGWSVEDLLGLDPASWMRLDRRGALFLHDGGEVVGFTAEEMIIRRAGSVMRWRRGSK